MQYNYFIKKTTLFFVFFTFSHLIFAQKQDSTKQPLNFSSAVSVTNTGISLLPSFSLGKPAAIFDMVLKKKKLSFEPQLRFALDGKPWSFIFWWRYKLLKTNKFSLGIGAHPSFLFKITTDAVVNGVTKNLISTQRYLATEIVPNFAISKNVSIGAYYLYSHCLEKDGVQNTNFVTLNANISNIKLYKDFSMRFSPQVFYLKMDKTDGFYANAALTFSKKNFPLSFALFGNQKIKSTIVSKDFVWNATLIYAINKKYIEQ